MHGTKGSIQIHNAMHCPRKISVQLKGGCLAVHAWAGCCVPDARGEAGGESVGGGGRGYGEEGWGPRMGRLNFPKPVGGWGWGREGREGVVIGVML